ncbi:hypothetical protein NARC_50088 [Candidatus Nitrosocosmicus arcticus]|uniref:Uncharacterized protein n=1 Tax=Candidatus Nitrosocosmicus arcticus TaxID=2035267 RepID=A0A557SWB7_9ARCH|nr:hypothetical protein NARC_50088 [Candidatus Nitrosocosmicus arcticus]
MPKVTKSTDMIADFKKIMFFIHLNTILVIFKENYDYCIKFIMHAIIQMICILCS